MNRTWKAEQCHTQGRGQYAHIGVARPQPSSSGQVQVSKRRGVYSGKLVVGSLLQRDWSSSSLIVGKLKTIPHLLIQGTGYRLQVWSNISLAPSVQTHGHQTWKKARPVQPRVAGIFENCGRIYQKYLNYFHIFIKTYLLISSYV